MLPSPKIEATITGAVSGQVAVGNYIVQNNVDHGAVVFVAAPGERPTPRARALPVRLAGRPAAIVGRASELATIKDLLGPASPLLLHGRPGIGKTALLKCAARDHAERTDESVVYHTASGEPPADTLQFLFEVFYECDVPFKAVEAQIRHALADTGGLIVLDDLSLDRDGLAALLDAMPSATLLLASDTQRLLPSGRAMALRGMLPDDAVALLSYGLGRALTPEEDVAGRAVLGLLGNEPLRVLQLAALVGTLGQELPRLATELEHFEAPVEDLVRRLVSSLNEEERQVLDGLAAAAGSAATAEQLSRLTGLPNVKPEIGALMQLGLAQAHSPRCSATAAVTRRTPEEDVPRQLAACMAATDPEGAAGLAGAVLRAFETAEARADWQGSSCSAGRPSRR